MKTPSAVKEAGRSQTIVEVEYPFLGFYVTIFALPGSVELEHGGPQTAEVHAGGGYLSQSTAALRFGLGHGGQVKQIKVRWPDARTTSHTIAPGQRSITITQPAR
jgi:hypothetical protein